MTILGLMSGTSLDGIDMAVCEVDASSCHILHATTVPYDEEWRGRLASLDRAPAFEYVKADVELGTLFAKKINEFVSSVDVRVEAVASHGHTIFHQPHLGVTTQIGDGDAIAAGTGLPVVSRFRSLDVALGGQGAPLVPLGDEMLFDQYDACLNLGGIANVSYRFEGKRVAFDICPCNMALNPLASRLGLAYDPAGGMARNGRFDHRLNQSLDTLGYYQSAFPKSLGKEWYESEFRPLVEGGPLPVEDLLCTVTHHIAGQIAQVLRKQGVRNVLVTGGGAYNAYLLELINRYYPSVELVVPNDLIINYKEAMIFAYLGYLRLHGRVNTLASVTGARCDSSGGSISGIFAMNPTLKVSF